MTSFAFFVFIDWTAFTILLTSRCPQCGRTPIAIFPASCCFFICGCFKSFHPLCQTIHFTAQQSDLCTSKFVIENKRGPSTEDAEAHNLIFRERQFHGGVEITQTFSPQGFIFVDNQSACFTSGIYLVIWDSFRRCWIVFIMRMLFPFMWALSLFLIFVRVLFSLAFFIHLSFESRSLLDIKT